MYRLSYYPWLTQNVPSAEIAAQINNFARLVQAELTKLGHSSPQIQVLPPVDVPEQIEQVVGGGAEIFLMNPLGFVFARNRTGDAEAVAIAERIIDGKKGVVYFAQLYAHADVDADPASAGRMMNAHFATRLVDEDGGWRPQVDSYNVAADISPTAGQMPRLVGLAHASRMYRELDELRELTQFSRGGDEVAFGTIGNASCAEGMFWEALNAIGVLRAPAVIAIWDDGYGISVPNEHQIAKGDLSSLLAGFRRSPDADSGFDLRAQERAAIERTLERFRGNRRETAEALKISAVTLWRRMKQYGLSDASKD